MGCLLYYPFFGCNSLRENNNDIACWLLTGFRRPPAPLPPLCVLTTVEEAGHHSSVGQGNPRKEKQRDNREDIVLWQLASFPIFSRRQCVNQGDSLLWGLGHCKPMLQQRQCVHLVYFSVTFDVLPLTFEESFLCENIFAGNLNAAWKTAIFSSISA